MWAFVVCKHMKSKKKKLIIVMAQEQGDGAFVTLNGHVFEHALKYIFSWKQQLYSSMATLIQ